jgi:hypothetical protein
MAHFMIDPMSRSITMKSALQNIIQHDHNAERAIFEVPRYIQEKDMLSCSKIEIHYINMGSDKSKQSADVYIVDDVHISTRSDNVVEFSWLISKNATRYAGSTSFLVRFIHLNGTEIEYAWHTEPYKSLVVSDGMDNGEPVDAFFSDVLEAWKREVVSYLHRSIQQKADETLATIPEDYATLDSTTKQNTAKISRNDKRITNLEHGIPPELFETDSSVAYFKSVPDKALPYAEIQHVGGITRKCNNLIPFPYHGPADETQEGYFTTNGDGSITANISPATQYWIYVLTESLYLPQGTYCFTLYGSTHMYGYVDVDGMQYNNRDNNVFTLDAGTTVSIYLDADWIDEAYTETVYPMLNRGDTPSSYEPYFEGLRTAKVTEIESVGINLIPNDSRAAAKDFTLISYIDVGDIFADHIGKTITLSFDMRLKTLNAASNHISIYPYQMSGISIADDRTIFPTTDWQRYYFTTTVKDHGQIINNNNGIIALYDNNEPANEYSIRDIQITLGSEEKPYRPQMIHTLPIPAEVQALDGYGYSVRNNLFNYIDFEHQFFTERVGCVDMGTLTWKYDSVNKVFTATVEDMQPDSQGLLCEKYELSPAADSARAFDKTIYGRSVNNETGTTRLGSIGVKDSGYTNAELLKSSLDGVMLYYELADPQHTDISHLITTDNFIGVESGGVITAVNDYLYAVPTVITYMLKEETV